MGLRQPEPSGGVPIRLPDSLDEMSDVHGGQTPLPRGCRLVDVTARMPQDGWGEAGGRQRESGGYVVSPSTCSPTHPKRQVSVL